MVKKKAKYASKKDYDTYLSWLVEKTYLKKLKNFYQIFMSKFKKGVPVIYTGSGHDVLKRNYIYYVRDSTSKRVMLEGMVGGHPVKNFHQIEIFERGDIVLCNNSYYAVKANNYDSYYQSFVGASINTITEDHKHGGWLIEANSPKKRGIHVCYSNRTDIKLGCKGWKNGTLLKSTKDNRIYKVLEYEGPVYHDSAHIDAAYSAIDISTGKLLKIARWHAHKNNTFKEIAALEIVQAVVASVNKITIDETYKEGSSYLMVDYNPELEKILENVK